MGWFEDTVQRATNVVTNPTSHLVPGGWQLNALGAVSGGSGKGFGGMAEGVAGPAAVMGGGGAAERDADFTRGLARGKELFRDQEMMGMRDKLADYAKGYDSKELGAIRQNALSQIQGQRGQYLNQLAGKAARGGVGGARAAAMQGAADQGFMKQRAGAERAMALDSANMKRSGNQALQEYIMKQRLGEMSTGISEAQMGATERAGQSALAASQKEPKKGVIGQIFGDLF